MKRKLFDLHHTVKDSKACVLDLTCNVVNFHAKTNPQNSSLKKTGHETLNAGMN